MANTLGQLMANSIKLMFDNVGKEISITSQSDLDNLLKDTNFARRLVNIREVINSGLIQCEKAKALPHKRYDLTREILDNPAYTTRNAHLLRVDLSLVVDDFASVTSLIEFSDYDYTVKINPLLEGNNVIVLREKSGYEYSITYLPKVCQITDSTAVNDVMDVPNEIFCALPYWVKANLYEIDEPQMAERSKNMFYEMLRITRQPENCGGESVKMVYGEEY